MSRTRPAAPLVLAHNAPPAGIGMKDPAAGIVAHFEKANLIRPMDAEVTGALEQGRRLAVDILKAVAEQERGDLSSLTIALTDIEDGQGGQLLREVAVVECTYLNGMLVCEVTYHVGGRDSPAWQNGISVKERREWLAALKVCRCSALGAPLSPQLRRRNHAAMPLLILRVRGRLPRRSSCTTAAASPCTAARPASSASTSSRRFASFSAREGRASTTRTRCGHGARPSSPTSLRSPTATTLPRTARMWLSSSSRSFAD